MTDVYSPEEIHLFNQIIKGEIHEGMLLSKEMSSSSLIHGHSPGILRCSKMRELFLQTHG